LKVNVIHPSLNHCGGAERLSLSVMKAILNIGARFDFTSYEIPHLARLKNSFGAPAANVLKRALKVNILKSALDNQNGTPKGGYDLTVNTHSEGLPYYQTDFSKGNCISYCNFPTARNHIETMNEDYLRETRIIRNENRRYTSFLETKRKKAYFEQLMRSHRMLMDNSVVLTNSRFSKYAIKKALGVEARVLYPPVDTENFRSLALNSNYRDDIILVICRIVPSKKIENAISIAKILKQMNTGKRISIIGNMYDGDLIAHNYYRELRQMVKINDLSDFVTFQINLSRDKLIENMRRASVYLHTREGEHFGITTAEAMSAGLIPVVANNGGHTEFVPTKYQFTNLQNAAEIISDALNASSAERLRVSESVMKFSVESFMKSFQSLLSF
jgi:glycosyltransferase involved in cell wall biosynthesis